MQVTHFYFSYRKRTIVNEKHALYNNKRNQTRHNKSQTCFKMIKQPSKNIRVQRKKQTHDNWYFQRILENIPSDMIIILFEVHRPPLVCTISCS